MRGIESIGEVKARGKRREKEMKEGIEKWI